MNPETESMQPVVGIPEPAVTRLARTVSRIAALHGMRSIAAVMLLACGCQGWPYGGSSVATPSTGAVAALPNPMTIASLDREFLWYELVDTVDDYFQVEREERVQEIGGVLTEGSLTTFPKAGATWLEPWRTDSTWGYERNLATLQSIRRRATVRVIPANGSYLVAVEVAKELEDVIRPEHATVGMATPRHDQTLLREQDEKVVPQGTPIQAADTLGWIPMGRDTSLEQQILGDLQQRLTDSSRMMPQSRGVLDWWQEKDR